MTTKNKIYVVIIDRVSYFIRQELTVKLFINEEEAQLDFWALVAHSKQHLPYLEDDEELVEESEVGMWQVYLSGNWSDFHIQVLIRCVEVH